jgi:hypothetical protein
MRSEINLKLIINNKHKESFISKVKMIGLCLMMALVLSGCASMTKSTLLGFGTGAVVGGASGALIDKQNPSQAALTTALIMGAIGGIAGYFTHDALESRDAEVRKETLFNLEKYGVSGFSNGIKVKDSEPYYMNQDREGK